MLTFNATDVATALSDTASITYGWEGDNVVSGSDNFGGLPSGTLPTGSPGAIWPALAGQSTVYLKVFNPGATTALVKVYKNAVQITQFTVAGPGTSVYDGKVFKFDQFGNSFTNG